MSAIASPSLPPLSPALPLTLTLCLNLFLCLKLFWMLISVSKYRGLVAVAHAPVLGFSSLPACVSPACVCVSPRYLHVCLLHVCVCLLATCLCVWTTVFDNHLNFLALYLTLHRCLHTLHSYTQTPQYWHTHTFPAFMHSYAAPGLYTHTYFTRSHTPYSPKNSLSLSLHLSPYLRCCITREHRPYSCAIHATHSRSHWH